MELDDDGVVVDVADTHNTRHILSDVREEKRRPEKVCVCVVDTLSRR